MNSPITIRSIEIRECRNPALWRGRYTSGGMDPAEDVRLFVAISDGRHTGYGECVPTSLYYPPGHIGRSDIDEWKTVLAMADAMLGKDARGLGILLGDDHASQDANSIRDALDFALHDMVGHALQTPVAVLLGGFRGVGVRGIPVIHNNPPEVMAAEIRRLRREWGFVHFKLKPFGALEPDRDLLMRIREEAGTDLLFTMDANYRLRHTEPDDAVNYLETLFPLGLETYEDPLDVDDATLRHIRERTRVRIMVDEKARSPSDVMRVIQAECADQINIHANWAGGFQAGIDKARMAWVGGLPTMIGSVRYLGPGAAAYITLASVLPGDVLCEQEFAEIFGRHSIVTPYAVKDGRWKIPDAPGLGIQLDLAALEAITARREMLM